jgi:glycerophosphoryl diester phosphodiesterase
METNMMKKISTSAGRAVAAAIITGTVLACGAAGAASLPPTIHGTRVIAHRGASGSAPENTMVSFKRAYEMGADMIELDVHRASDGVLVVIHDDDTKRTTGVPGKVAEMSSAQIAALDAGSWFSKDFAGEPIPTLRQVLEWASDKMQVNIEIKSAGCEEGVAAMINEFGMKDNVIVTSFGHSYLKKIKELDSEITTGALTEDIIDLADIDKIIEECAPDALNPRYIMANKKVIKRAQERGLSVNIYTVNDAITMNRLARDGANGIITNHPDILIEVLKRLKTKTPASGAEEAAK